MVIENPNLVERFLHYYLDARLLIIPRRWQRHQPVIIITVDAVIISDDPVVSFSIDLVRHLEADALCLAVAHLTTFHRSSRRKKIPGRTNHAPGTHPESINLAPSLNKKNSLKTLDNRRAAVIKSHRGDLIEFVENAIDNVSNYFRIGFCVLST